MRYKDVQALSSAQPLTLYCGIGFILTCGERKGQ
jgi:hypothetical protein